MKKYDRILLPLSLNTFELLKDLKNVKHPFSTPEIGLNNEYFVLKSARHYVSKEDRELIDEIINHIEDGLNECAKKLRNA
jgi:hypothetical protein